MNEPPPASPKKPSKRLFLSVADMLLRAVVLTVLFGMAHLAGWREYTSFISGTSADTTLSPMVVSFLGLGYLVVYFAFILAVPILLIAAGVLALWNRLGRF